MSLSGTTYIPGFIPVTDSEGIVYSNSRNLTDVAQGRVPDQFLFFLPARNPAINTADTPTAIWNGGKNGSAYVGAYTGLPPFTLPAETFTITSASANDTAAGTGARIVRVYYMNTSRQIIDANGDLIFEDVPMNGTTGATTTATGFRIWRVAVISAGSSRFNEGEITVSWSSTTSYVFCVMPAEGAITQLGSFPCPIDFTAYLIQSNLTLNDKTANAASAYLQLSTAQVDYKTRYVTVSNDKNSIRMYPGGLQIPVGADLVWYVDSVASNGADISLEYELLLVRNP